MVTEPKVSQKDQTKNNHFGYHDTFNGIGIYTFAHQGYWYMTVFNDLGVTEVTLDLVRERI